MCGIAGFVGAYPVELLGDMTAMIAHRGPDDAGIWHDTESHVGLGHRRLSIIDLSPRGHQPMRDAAKKAVIVFNGEIYNYRELRAELAGEYAFRSHSDTEVILNLYRRHGAAMLERLNGIFAFALWDAAQRELFLARDQLGVKPLYYAETPSGFVFASEIKALLLVPDLDRALDLEAVTHYLSYLWCPAPQTMLRAVRKLEAGQALLVREGRVCKHLKYYELPYGQPTRRMDADDAAEQVRDRISVAVRRQMVADVPVGSFLSGGLDSSTVVSQAIRTVAPRDLHCFTIGFTDATFADEGLADDLPYAQLVARHLDVPLHTAYVGAELAQQLPLMVFHLDEPQGDIAPLLVYHICRLAREHGTKVLLSGAGGDDIFSGYRRHRAVLYDRYWPLLPKSARRALRRLALRPSLGGAVGRRLARLCQFADLDGDDRLASYFHWLHPEQQENLYTAALAECGHRHPFSRPLTAALASLPEATSPLDRMLFLDTRFFLGDHNLNYTDKLSMATGIEVRVPLLDPDLVAFAARLPSQLKQNGRHGKWVLKHAMRDLLPNEVIRRPKTGFGVPLRRWLRRDLRPLVDEFLAPSALARRGLFAADSVRTLVQLDRAGIVDAAYPILVLLNIELWCRTFLDQRVPSKLTLAA